ncbi:MAG TPA: CocE/NonD family hydrolase [Steroidobacteraceae bacterium]|nr:CocE/NonD family hydrolase [Steroidobacteraceae bacterium]
MKRAVPPRAGLWVALIGLAWTGWLGATEPPTPALYGVRMEQTSIPMRDGVRLAVTLYMPTGAPKGARFPVLLEYLPYRKDDDEAVRDYGNHTYFARRGFVGARVDIRGFGNSEGVPPEREYSARELADGDEVIAWLARQPWSNGKVGMFGISWGGFNSIQMAMRWPPALKAIMPVDATEALFKEDVHYMDGIFHVDEFELTMDLDQGRSGAPDFSLDEKVIGPRMDSEPWSLNYMRKQRDGAFWHEPVRPLEQLRVPCFLIGGLQDGYRDSVPRMLERVAAPVKAWIGPWNHAFPNGSDYGPLVEWRGEAVRWFDYWLKGRDTGVLRDPKVLIYLQHWHPPTSAPQDVPGEWRAETWPPHDLKWSTWYLRADHQLGAGSSTPTVDQLAYMPSAGVEAGFWWGELLTDQRPVDAYSLTYDSQPLESDVAIIGLPRVVLQAAATAPLAHWFARLEDVAPDGRVTMVTGAGLNGAQRNSMADPRDLEPGHTYELKFDLHLASWIFPKGHRIRLAVSNALWPMTWPTPYPMTTSLQLGGVTGSRLELPQVGLQGRAAPEFTAPEPVETRADIKGGASAWPGTWTLFRDEAGQKSQVVWEGKTSTDYAWGRFDHTERLAYTLDDAHPQSAAVTGDSEYIQKSKGHALIWRGHLTVTSDAGVFHYAYTRQLLRDTELVRTRSWKEDIPRDHQ